MRLIDADELKEKLQGHKDLFVNAWGGREEFIANAPKDEKARVDELNVCIAEIVNAPTVCEMYGDIPEFHEPQKGEWIDDFRSDYEPFMQRGWKCTNCGKRTTYGKPAFCMYCGAEMRGGES